MSDGYVQNFRGKNRRSIKLQLKKDPLLRRVFVRKSGYSLVLQADFITCFSIAIFLGNQQVRAAFNQVRLINLR